MIFLNKFLLQELENWCDSCDTQFSRVSYKEENGIVKIYRVDGQSFPQSLHTFRTEEQLKDFLKEVEELRNDLRETEEYYNKKMALQVNCKLNKADHRNKKNKIDWKC